MIESIHLAHTPADTVVFAMLFKDVENTAFLREQLLAGNTDFEYAFIDAATILSRRHALSAVFRSITDATHTRLKSRNIHSEIVFSLSGANNIGEAFRRFGISDVTRDLLVFKVGDAAMKDGVERHLLEHVQGRVVPFTDEEVRGCTDFTRVRKIYKLGGGGGSLGGAKGKKGGNLAGRSEAVSLPLQASFTIEDIKEVETQVLGLMALRGAT